MMRAFLLFERLGTN